MRVLLDTHAFLWFVLGDTRLSVRARTVIEDPDNQRFVSLASAWEMAIKVSIGKLTAIASSKPFAEDLLDKLSANDMTLLPVDLLSVAQTAYLPFHHRDPFDRLIVAQSIIDNLTLISVDTVFDAYGVARIW